jgi:hypothetical protein
MSKLLTESDFERAANALNCDVAAIKAVCEVEAPQGGFHDDGVTPRILFEAHHFSRLTGHQFDASNPGVSARHWNRSLYKGGIAEHKRLQEAAALQTLPGMPLINVREAALQSASWGKFQIMGFNWTLTGAKSLQAFINDMYRDEGAHLDAFIGFVKANNLADALRDHRWDAFARGYNGSGYAANQYDTKLANAYAKYA